MFSNCADKDDYHPNCEYYKDEHDSVEKNHYWLLRNHVGDTLWFKVYQVNHDSGKREYHFQREVYFVATDSTVDSLVEIVDVTDHYPCQFNRYYYPITIHYQGEGNLRCQIVPQGSFDWLNIILQKKEYLIDNEQIINNGFRWFEQIKIGGKLYHAVNCFFGDEIGGWKKTSYDTTGTQAYYNLDYGMLKLLINDTLVYERELK